MLEKEYKYYQDHLEELKQKYLNKFIVIISEEIIAAYDSQNEAVTETLKTHTLGTFLVQHISQNTQDIVHRFTSRVYV